MYGELKNAIREYLGTEKVMQEDGRALIRRAGASPDKVFRTKSDIAEFYLRNEQEIKEFIVDQGEGIDDIEDSVFFVFAILCEEMEEEAAIIDEFEEYNDEREDWYGN